MTALIAALWLAGGVLFAHASLNNPDASPEVAETSRFVLAGLWRCEPAALIAVAAFLVIWPVVFIGAKAGKWRSRNAVPCQKNASETCGGLDNKTLQPARLQPISDDNSGRVG